jgi:hypothetical protein
MKLVLVVANLLLIAASSLPVGAQIVLQPGPQEGKDAWVRSGSPDVNNGTHSDLRFGASPTFWEERHTYIEFDLSALPAGTVIVDATLELYMWGQNGIMSYMYGVYPVKESWDEDSITWSTAPASSPEPAVEFDGRDWQAKWEQWHAVPGLRDLVQSWIDDPTSNHGMMIRAVSNYYGEPYIYSSDSPHADLRPRLLLQLQPVSTEPTPWSELKGYFGNE